MHGTSVDGRNCCGQKRRVTTHSELSCQCFRTETNVFPIDTLTKDNKSDIDMGWNPKVLLTGERVSFILDLSDPVTSKRHHLLSYDFVISQDGAELKENQVFRK